MHALLLLALLATAHAEEPAEASAPLPVPERFVVQGADRAVIEPCLEGYTVPATGALGSWLRSPEPGSWQRRPKLAKAQSRCISDRLAAAETDELVRIEVLPATGAWTRIGEDVVRRRAIVRHERLMLCAIEDGWTFDLVVNAMGSVVGIAPGAAPGSRRNDHACVVTALKFTRFRPGLSGRLATIAFPLPAPDPDEVFVLFSAEGRRLLRAPRGYGWFYNLAERNRRPRVWRMHGWILVDAKGRAVARDDEACAVLPEMLPERWNTAFGDWQLGPPHPQDPDWHPAACIWRQGGQRSLFSGFSDFLAASRIDPLEVPGGRTARFWVPIRYSWERF